MNHYLNRNGEHVNVSKVKMHVYLHLRIQEW